MLVYIVYESTHDEIRVDYKQEGYIPLGRLCPQKVATPSDPSMQPFNFNISCGLPNASAQQFRILITFWA